MMGVSEGRDMGAASKGSFLIRSVQLCQAHINHLASGAVRMYGKNLVVTWPLQQHACVQSIFIHLASLAVCICAGKWFFTWPF